VIVSIKPIVRDLWRRGFVIDKAGSCFWIHRERSTFGVYVEKRALSRGSGRSAQDIVAFHDFMLERSPASNGKKARVR
jgi:hypothetical protein